MMHKTLKFTLLELLIVIGIIGLLAGLLFPVISKAKARSKKAACIGNLKQLGIAINAYADNNNGRLPYASRVGTGPADPTQVCNIFTAGNQEVFQCPADTLNNYDGQTHFARYGNSYEWSTWANGRLIEKANFEIQSVKIYNPLLADAEKYHGALGKNFLYEDGSVTKLRSDD